MPQTGKPLGARRILVVEDEYFLAMEVEDVLLEAGALIEGPYARMNEALRAARHDALDAGVLNINLGGLLVYPVAALLKARGIPFVFATSYAGPAIPPEWRSIARWEKPFDPQGLVAALADMIARRAA